MKFLRRVVADLRFNSTPRAKRLNEVRHLDENAAARRRATHENAAEVTFHLSQLAKAKHEQAVRRG